MFISKFNFALLIQHISNGLKKLNFINRNSKDLSSAVSSLHYFNSDKIKTLLLPQQNVCIDRLTRIQILFLKTFYYRTNSLPSGLYVSDFVSLKNRRTLTEMIFLFKLINGDVFCPNQLNLLNILYLLIK